MALQFKTTLVLVYFLWQRLEVTALKIVAFILHSRSRLQLWCGRWSHEPLPPISAVHETNAAGTWDRVLLF